jgi:GSH-dependent disulfide-bond oxidoreductase
MIDVYTWPTPNGHKVHIMLYETGLEHAIHPINIQEGDQFKPEFLEISPNNKMPAIIDRNGPGGREISVFESGAILVYLANKTGRFLPDLATDPHGYYDVLQWLMFQMGGVGPMLGQAHHFNAYAPDRFPAEQIDYGRNRYINEANRIYGVIDRRLQGRDWIAAGQYSIADMAIFPWLRDPAKQGVDITDYPEVERWRQKIWQRPRVIEALEVLKDRGRRGPISDKQWEIMYGATQRKQGGAAAE